MKYCFSILLFVLSLIGFSQVSIDHKLVFTSPYVNERTITGLADVSDTASLVSVGMVIKNNLLYYEVNESDTLQPGIPSGFLLTEGMGVWIKNGKNTDNNLFLTFDNINYYSVFDANGMADTNCIKKNEIELFVFNGTSFQEIFPGFKICPQGFVDVNTEYCIQQQENALANYWYAIADCNKQNAKLCSWGEWYYACQKSGLGLLNMTNNWEWSESANNHATSVMTYGNLGCTNSSESNTQTATKLKYRCCYRKK